MKVSVSSDVASAFQEELLPCNPKALLLVRCWDPDAKPLGNEPVLVRWEVGEVPVTTSAEGCFVLSLELDDDARQLQQLRVSCSRFAPDHDLCELGSIEVAPGDKKELACRYFGAWKLDSVSFPPTLAPGAEAVKPRIGWTVTDAHGAVQSGELCIYGNEIAEPILRRQLEKEELTPGPHEWEWEGQLGESFGPDSDFPQQHVNWACSPYRIQVTLTGRDGKRQAGTAGFAVELHSLELVRGNPDHLKPPDKSITLSLTEKLSSDSKPRPPRVKAMFQHHAFVADKGEMTGESPVAYTTYQDAWGEGPQLALEALVRFKDSNGAPVLAPKAWGHKWVRWRWELDEDKRLDGQPLGFFGKLMERLGARYTARLGAPASTQDYPYHLEGEAADMYSLPALEGPSQGRTGVIFHPCGQTGGNYKLTVSFGEVEAELIIELHRSIKVNTLRKSNVQLSPLPLEEVSRRLGAAYITLVQGETYGPFGERTFNSLFLTAVDNLPKSESGRVIRAMVKGVKQTKDNNDYACVFVDLEQLKVNYEEARRKQHEEEGLDVDVDDYVKEGWAALKLTDKKKYASTCDKAAREIWRWLARELTPPDCGLTICYFQKMHNFVDDGDSVVLGVAMGCRDRTRTALLCMDANSGENFASTVAHEMGHTLFLAHAPFPVGAKPGGHEAAWHDPDDSLCLMGYEHGYRHFCGMCLIRLRGFDYRGLKLPVT